MSINEIEVKEIVNQINQIFNLPELYEYKDYWLFKRIDQYAGGNKVMGPSMCAGAFNYLNLSVLLHHIYYNVAWEDPKDSAIVWQCEEDEKPTFHYVCELPSVISKLPTSTSEGLLL